MQPTGGNHHGKFINIFYTFKADGIIIGGEGDIWANENQRKNCTEA